MSHCVPSWDLDDNPTHPRLPLRPHSNSNSMLPDVPMLDYEVAELTWENGQLAMHGLGPPRVPTKQLPTNSTKYVWEKPRAGGTLESLVNQATSCLPHYKPAAKGGCDELVPWLDRPRAASATMAMDALVPCSREPSSHVREGIGTCGVGCSTLVGSCSGANTLENSEALKRASVGRVPSAAAAGGHEWSSPENSVSGSATFGRDSRQDNTSSAKHTKGTTVDDHDSVCHSTPQREAGDVDENKKKAGGKSSISTKRSRAAAIHNQSERKRRDKINQKMKTLQKLVPNSSKTDKASMLDEVIEYLKQLQAQVHMMSRMTMPSMMLPVTLQQQLQLSMMAPMGMGMGMGMAMGMGVMDMNTIARPNIPGIPPVLHPAAAFMPLTSWDGGSGDQRLSANPAIIPDPMSTFLACQSQPMTMDAYSRMAALYQQLHQHPASGSKR